VVFWLAEGSRACAISRVGAVVSELLSPADEDEMSHGRVCCPSVRVIAPSTRKLHLMALSAHTRDDAQLTMRLVLRKAAAKPDREALQD
jgi:hypothetical protein